MKSLLLLVLLTNSAMANYQGSHISDVWETVQEKSYSKLPQTKVNMNRLTKWGKSKLEQSANRTISNRSDILPYFEKLVHPNGTCLLGEWKIDEDNIYTGYFKKGSQGLIVSRASVALSDTKRGKRRSFGLAGKIYPTTDINHSENLETANFFTMDDLGGTKIKKFSLTKLTNEPELSVSLGAIFLIRMARFVSKAFTNADNNPGLRQLWQISSLGLKDGEAQLTPMWMRLSAVKGFEYNSEKDFRNEIAENIKRNGDMTFSIEVAGTMNAGSEQVKSFTKIGTIKYTEISASEGCDHRLHFNHPKLRADLN
ncbi:hypothetical protein A9Q84_01730 [Halobacteriovorax marinus]|uniref:Uncharacterized protein n=1 Tax=Halobacteriovorax marinus TaxID=97084 RepID=A0A1Y5FC45_9BACT|nr:hypothetical protein A9Q84_01730 [Halobacteriovorax marinus]